MKIKLLYSLNLLILFLSLFIMYPNYRKNKEETIINNKTIIGEITNKESLTISEVDDYTFESDPN